MKPIILFCVLTYTYGIQLPAFNINFGIPVQSLPTNFFSGPFFNDPLFQQDDVGPVDALYEEFGNAQTTNSKAVETKKETQQKDGFEITTINKTGPGFFSYMSEIRSKGNKTNGTNIDMESAMMKVGNLFNGFMHSDTVKGKCETKCQSSEFCDPFFGKCRKRFSVGTTCMMANQCKNNLICVWGRCEKANKGDPGTFCKSKRQCKGDACCVKQENAFHSICIPQLDEGAICGTKGMDLFMTVLSPQRSQLDNECSPCKSYLKCGNTGHPQYKRCVQMSYVEESSKNSENFSKVLNYHNEEDNIDQDDKKHNDNPNDNGSSHDEETRDIDSEPIDEANVTVKKPSQRKKKITSGKEAS